MRHGDGMRNQRFDRAQVFRQRPQFDAVHQAFAGLEAALEFAPEHGAETRGLAACQFVLREGLKSRVADLADGRVSAEVLCDRHRTGGLPVHPHRQRLHTLQGQPGDHRRHDAAGGVLHETQFLVQFGSGRHIGASYRGVVSVEVLGGAVQGYVRAKGKRLLVIGGEKSVVDHVDQIIGPGNFRQGSDVAQRQCRVGRCLGQQQPCLGRDRRLDCLRVRRINKRKARAEACEDLGAYAVGSTVSDLRYERVIARVQEGMQHRADGRHPGGVAGTVLAVLQAGKALFQGPHRRIAAARIGISLRKVLVDGGLGKGRGLVNRRQHRSRHGVRLRSRVNLFGGKAHVRTARHSMPSYWRRQRAHAGRGRLPAA